MRFGSEEYIGGDLFGLLFLVLGLGGDFLFMFICLFCGVSGLTVSFHVFACSCLFFVASVSLESCFGLG